MQNERSEPAGPTRRASLPLDMLAAYAAAGMRIVAWAVVSAMVYRLAGAAHFAMLALIRGTIGILNYTSVGLTPALIRLLAQARGSRTIPAEPASAGAAPCRDDEHAIYSTGLAVASVSAGVGLLIAALYAAGFDKLCVVPPALARQAPWAVLLIGGGTLCRLFSDASGALLQVRRHIALDNALLASSDGLWAVATLALFRHPGLLTASITYAAAGGFLVIARTAAAACLTPSPWPPRLAEVRSHFVWQLLSFGSLVLISQLAEYFYAPTDYILINHFFGPNELAAYAPAVQIDSGLLLFVTAMATVLLPRAALAHAAGNIHAVRRYYLRGAAVSTLLLIVAAAVVWRAYPLLFRLWFGAHPPHTRAILDLMLASTIIGGSSAVGRSILLATGRIRSFTAAAVIAGVVNVIASYCFVKYAGLGLRGILYGTLVAVVARCGLWMPWYVLRTLRRDQANKQPSKPAPDPFALREEIV